MDRIARSAYGRFPFIGCFGTMLGIALVMSLYPHAAMGAATASTAPSSDLTIQRFPSFGLALTPPKGWIRLPEDGDTMVAQWADSRGKPGAGPSTLRLQIYPHDEASLGDFTSNLAQYTDSSIIDRQAKMGGLPAIELAANPRTGAAHPAYLTRARVVEHAGRFFELVYLTAPGATDFNVFSTMADSIAWSDPVHPHEALTPRDRSLDAPLKLFQTDWIFMLPDPFRCVQNTDDEIKYVAHDYINNSAEASIWISREATKGLKLPAIERTLAIRWALPTTSAWRAVSDSVGISPIKTRADAMDGSPQGPIQLVVAVTDHGEHLDFVVEFATDASIHDFLPWIDAMAKSIRPAPAKP